MLGWQKSWAALLCHFLGKNDPHPPLLAIYWLEWFYHELVGFLAVSYNRGGQNSCLVGPLVPHFWATPTPRKHEPAKYQAGTQESKTWPRIGSHPLQDHTDWVDKSKDGQCPSILHFVPFDPPESIEKLSKFLRRNLNPWGPWNPEQASTLGAGVGTRWAPRIAIQCLKCPLVTYGKHWKTTMKMIGKWSTNGPFSAPPDIYIYIPPLRLS